MQVPYLLRKTYGHLDMGVYAEIIEGGTITAGNRIVALKARDSELFADFL
jgi:MOSC domain-containing protein YiiM